MRTAVTRRLAAACRVHILFAPLERAAKIRAPIALQAPPRAFKSTQTQNTVVPKPAVNDAHIPDHLPEPALVHRTNDTPVVPQHHWEESWDAASIRDAIDGNVMATWGPTNPIKVRFRVCGPALPLRIYSLRSAHPSLSVWSRPVFLRVPGRMWSHVVAGRRTPQ